MEGRQVGLDKCILFVNKQITIYQSNGKKWVLFCLHFGFYNALYGKSDKELLKHIHIILGKKIKHMEIIH